MTFNYWFAGALFASASFSSLADDSFPDADRLAAMNAFMAEEVSLETGYDAGGLRYLSMVVGADEATKTMSMALQLEMDANLSIEERREISTSMGFEHEYFSCQFLSEYLPLFSATTAFTTRITLTSADGQVWYNAADTCELGEL
ncbi:hypothetical protein [Pseudidiomarina mangrovi]|uniref:hypothetical protein n=1 Tax=Pseudidiomarina mangrovi TaxID=2487133 RepID=UPI000FCB224C|nr:hypothetical protein [Pseudidiomarina mangrovi]